MAAPLTRLAALLLTGTLLAGCSTDLPFDDDGSARARARAIVDQVRDAVEEAKERSAAESRRPRPAAGARGREGAADGHAHGLRLRGVRPHAADGLRLARGVLGRGAAGAVRRALQPAEPVRLLPPGRGRRAALRAGAAPARNAFYCPAGDFIAWDESGLLIPYYVQAGDFAAAFVLAHEFGHAMQARLPRKERLGVLAELQADCFAGAWARSVQDEGLLAAGDLDEATLAVFSARDVPGTEFTDPRAHGSGFERTRAFTDGYEGGPRRCYPAPGDDWVVSAGR